MTRYQNGQAPLSDLVYLGPEFYLPHGTAARWRELQRLAWEKYGVWLVVTPGWNGYRPLDVQFEYRKDLGIMAAVPGTSSHGLTFRGRDMAAIDVNNWRSLAASESLAWARFVALCKIVGFIVDFVTPREPWHIGDEAPFDAPAFAAVVINHATTAPAKRRKKTMNITAAYRAKNGTIAVQARLGGKLTELDDPRVWGAMAAATGAETFPLTDEEYQVLADRHGRLKYPAFDTTENKLPLVVYAENGDGTVYLYEGGVIRYLTNPKTLEVLFAQGAQAVTWPQGEIDSIRKQQSA